MSKKVVQKRKAFYVLEPDGFSVHTFELSMKLTSSEMKQMTDALYQQQKQERPKNAWIYRNGNTHTCTHYKASGLLITLLDSRTSDTKNFGYLYIWVSPRILINPLDSYRGILPPHQRKRPASQEGLSQGAEGLPL